MSLSPLAFLPPFHRPYRMATSIVIVAIDGTTEVEVTSGLRGTVYYHWWLNGAYLGRTLDGSRTFRLDEGEAARLDVHDTKDPNYDPATFDCQAAPARRLIAWTRSLDPLCAFYRIDQKKNNEAWKNATWVPADALTWQYTWESDILEDLQDYTWRVVPLDAASNAGTSITLPTEKIVRTPDAPRWGFHFNLVTRLVQFYK